MEGRGKNGKPPADFDKTFREAFGRAMTSEERRYFYLYNIALKDDVSQNDSMDDAAVSGA